MFSDLSEWVSSLGWLIVISDFIITHCIWMNLGLSTALIWALSLAIFIGFEMPEFGEGDLSYISWLEGTKNGESGIKFALFWGYLILIIIVPLFYSVEVNSHPSRDKLKIWSASFFNSVLSPWMFFCNSNSILVHSIPSSNQMER